MVRTGELRLSIDRAVTAAEFFFIEGWLLGPGMQEAAFEVSGRNGPCNSAVFRSERYDVNDAFKLPRFFPDQHLGFRVFGRLPSATAPAEPVLGLGIVRAGTLLCTLPLAMRAADSAEIAEPLLQSIRRHLPASGADLENAALLLNQVRARGLDREEPPVFPPGEGQAVDVLILARHRPEVAEMNATLIQQALPPAARVFVAAGDWNAARRTGWSLGAAPGQGPALHYLPTSRTLPSSLVIDAFLRSDHAPTVVIVMDDVFIAPCLPALAAAIRERRSLAVPRVRQLAPAPAVTAEAASPRGRDILGRDFLPLGALVLDAADAIAFDRPQLYDSRGFALEDLFNANSGKFLLSDRPCLDLLAEEQSGDAHYLNRQLPAQRSLAEA